MEILLLMVFYMLLFIAGSLCLLYRDSELLTTGMLGWLRAQLTEAVLALIPGRLQTIAASACHYLLFKRNSVFQASFVILQLLAHSVFLLDMLPVLTYFYPDANHTFWPFTAVFVNYLFFHLAWTTDPGEITAGNHERFMAIYEVDNALYPSGAKCKSCGFVKPARSKHCSTCNRCVHRFDHHCIWTNNCVGVYTHRYFILFMVSLMAMFVQGIYVGTSCCLLYAKLWRLDVASYVDSDGSVKPVTFTVAVQHLFMQVPRLLFLVIAITVLLVLVGIFLSQHLYLIFLNKTTNEDYKTKSLLHKRRLSESKPAGTGAPVKHISPSYTPYNRGIVNNTLEVFLPSYFIQKRIKSR